jgi:N-glycosylase/DNA lyase
MKAYRRDGWHSLSIKHPLNFKACVFSGQPLNFHSVHKINSDRAHACYVTIRGIIELEYGREGLVNALDYRYHGDYNAQSAKEEVIRRFGVEDDMQFIYDRINTDRYMKSAILKHVGMRVTQNEPWETTLCFLISQFNNIPRINQIVRTLISRFGEELDDGITSTRLFPTPYALSRVSLDELRSCGTGFRAKYIKNVAKACAEGADLNSVYSMSYDEGKAFLMELDGIGDKVADCILLMGYKKLVAFPIDVWVKKTMEKLYLGGRTTNIRAIHDFAERRWGDYAGYAQQYLFHDARLGGL